MDTVPVASSPFTSTGARPKYPHFSFQMLAQFGALIAIFACSTTRFCNAPKPYPVQIVR